MKKNNDYFAMMKGLSGYSLKLSEKLRDILSNFDPFVVPQMLGELHEIEHAADIAKHDMMKKLAAEFITPIEREDIVSLAGELDTVTDCAEDIMKRLYMMNITKLRHDVDSFMSLLCVCCGKLGELMDEFPNFRKSKKVHELVIEINRLESEGDKLYDDAVRNLYVTSEDPIEIMVWSEIYRRFEHCYDACEHVSEAVESVVMKNS